MSLSRRYFLESLTAGAACSWLNVRHASAAQPADGLETFVPTRAITQGPLNHWFGYYDKREFDPTGTRILSNEIAFEGRSPTIDDKIGVGYVDTSDNDRWVPLGTSKAWGWQQGCMLQWVGDKGERVLWNDREDDTFVCRLHDLSSGQTRTIPRPVYTISNDGQTALSADFRRIDNLRPGYGYDGLADPYVDQRAPSQSGIWRIDLATGKEDLIVSLADVAKIPWPDGSRHEEAWHYFNHLLINPSGTRFVALHRYRPEFDPKTLQFQGNFVTRMISGNLDGSDLYVLDPSGRTSHFIWKNDEELTMWTKPAGQVEAFYTFRDKTREVIPVGHEKMPTNGHNTYLNVGNEDWILNDTYPRGNTPRQTVYLYHVPSDRRFDLGHFPSPVAYRGEWRCDTHPRSSEDGMQVAIDSPHNGGRQVYLLGVKELVEKKA
ncbi:hypothetical protein [Neorhodopirellula pilleata]|uniref:Uncharacterized protein n=1 Tax=Neorhodopirellula pilleata TaxID=2714738 RepID=A0A5C6A236_9BACT|nr:hypothetical protein [Neorhodopirellula pilleata]TWT93609.1 hypothetical protein Pla100_41270 [Neorhodopirellula pilleata]